MDMADDGSKDKGEMHYTTPTLTNKEEWQSISQTTNGYSSEDRSNSPIDFSFKRKNGDNEISGSESAPSPASTNDTGIHLDDRKISNSDTEEKVSFNGIPPERIKSEPDINWSMSHNMANMLSAFQAGLIPNPMLGPLPSMAALLSPRFSQNKSSSARPFKSYPKDQLIMGGFGGHSPSDSNGLQNLSINGEEFMNIYRQHMLMGTGDREKTASPSQTQSKSPPIISTSPSSTYSANGSRPSFSPNSTRSPAQNSGISSTRNYVPGRKRPRSLPDEQKDESYWERRRKNNEAAKRSRDLRRAKEDEIAIRAALLEQENLKLRVEVAALKTETAKLRCMLYNS